MGKEIIDQLKTDTQQLDSTELLRFVLNFFPSAAFSTSFGLEDQVITHQLSGFGSEVEIFTLDTGRMFPETYAVWSRTLERFQLPIKVYYPQEEALQDYVSEHGPNAFYQSADLRKSCCYIRKVEPLNRALAGKKLWITGIRKEQSPNRTDMERFEYDEVHDLVKFHPLFDWTLKQVKDYIATHNVPYNSLHDKGFPSIGCAPCTRAVQPGEDFRSGRWWWEDSTRKECGLHESKV